MREKMEEIYQNHAKTVYGFLLTKTRNPDLAEELTQETFYRAVKQSGKFKGESRVSTWLCGIAKNVWLETLRHNHRESPLEDASEQATASSEILFFQKAEQTEIFKLLHQMQEPAREVLYLRLIGNLSFRQIGEVMNRNENWARVTYYRGKEKLVKEAEKNGR